MHSLQSGRGDASLLLDHLEPVLCPAMSKKPWENCSSFNSMTWAVSHLWKLVSFSEAVSVLGQVRGKLLAWRSQGMTSCPSSFFLPTPVPTAAVIVSVCMARRGSVYDAYSENCNMIYTVARPSWRVLPFNTRNGLFLPSLPEGPGLGNRIPLHI